MRAFMRSTRFKVMMSIIIILLIIMVLAMAIGFSAPQSSAMGAATTPIQAIGAQISASFNDFYHPRRIWQCNSPWEKIIARIAFCDVFYIAFFA